MERNEGDEDKKGFKENTKLMSCIRFSFLLSVSSFPHIRERMRMRKRKDEKEGNSKRMREKKCDARKGEQGSII